MTTPAPAEDVSLLDVTGIGGALKRDWPWIANRALVAVALPVLTALLVSSLDLLPRIAELRLPLTFLAVGPFPYEAKVVWFLMVLLVTATFFGGKRTGAMLAGLVFGTLTSVGFNYTRLRWTQVFGLGCEELDSGERSGFCYDPSLPPAAAWTYGVLLLVSVAAFLVLEAVLDTRRAQADRQLPDEETRALVGVSLRASALVLVLGLAAAAGIVVAAQALTPLLTSPGTLPRLNPVFLLFALGLVLVLAIVLAAKRRALADPPATPGPPKAP